MKRLRERLRTPRQPEARAGHLAVGFALFVSVVFAVQTFASDPTADHVPIAEVLAAAEDAGADLVVYDENAGTITVTSDGQETTAGVPVRNADPILQHLLDAKAPLEIRAAQPPSYLGSLILAVAPMLLLGAALLLYLRNRQGGGPVNDAERPDVRLDDVIGIDEAKAEATEIVGYLADPSAYDRVGARPPVGVLLTGPPGVGKTMLAKAIAGDAGVPFFKISGSDFVEMFAGLGSRRVRSLFTAARKAAQSAGGAIVFIDELDAVGRRRSEHAGSGGHREAEQTLNALLVELDGFTGRDGVIILAATNRPDVLDPALTRPGRFDRTITLGLPDLHARTRLLDHLLDQAPVPTQVDTAGHARRMTGSSGAALTNLINQAKIEAARTGYGIITDRHVDAAWDRLQIGTPRPDAVIDPSDRQTTVIHEAGHAVAGLLLPDAPAPTRVSALPHGSGVGGVTITDGTDRQMLTHDQALARLTVLMAGRAAEQLVLGPGATSNGAAGDIASATDLARAMITQWGWGTFGTVHLDGLGPDGTLAADVADGVATMLDAALQRAKDLLAHNRPFLDEVADTLDQFDTLTGQDLTALRNATDGTDVVPAVP
ncbi:Cell division protein FtsH (plasmid) [Euzebya pacifica]|uniref:Cell division protein FtsH n=1 Tax=Euzebya pacifica TaxID=1608957 RepID=A0A346Y602_9ACTN|nr:AAA family ATPase [Euzebya pacifica]AXV09899.1 Cell division protein FtsH [Euzebya pacifica]